jgi:hypothetical protein
MRCWCGTRAACSSFGIVVHHVHVSRVIAIETDAIGIHHVHSTILGTHLKLILLLLLVVLLRKMNVLCGCARYLISRGRGRIAIKVMVPVVDRCRRRRRSWSHPVPIPGRERSVHSRRSIQTRPSTSTHSCSPTQVLLLVFFLGGQFQLDPALLALFNLVREGPRRLLPIIEDDAVRQIKEMPGVTLDDAPHLLGAEGGLGRGALALPPVLPPRAERGESEHDVFVFRIRTEPGGDDGLDEGVGESRARQGFVGVAPFAAGGICDGVALGGAIGTGVAVGIRV